MALPLAGLLPHLTDLVGVISDDGRSTFVDGRNSIWSQLAPIGKPEVETEKLGQKRAEMTGNVKAVMVTPD
jgi:hypothetical protein